MVHHVPPSLPHNLPTPTHYAHLHLRQGTVQAQMLRYALRITFYALLHIPAHITRGIP
jgi:hypothetical protein